MCKCAGGIMHSEKNVFVLSHMYMFYTKSTRNLVDFFGTAIAYHITHISKEKTFRTLFTYIRPDV